MAAGKRRANTGSFKPGQSGNPTGKPKRLNAEERLDGWMNDLTGMGILGRDKTMGSIANTQFAPDPVRAEDALQLWRGDAIAARLIETIPNEALRQGWELCIGEQEAPDRFKPPDVSPAAAPTLPGKPKPSRADLRDIVRDARLVGRFDEADKIARELDAKISGADAKDLQETVSKKLRDLGALGAIKEAMYYRRAYGGGALLLGANDFATDLREPLDITRVRSLDWLTPLEPRELMPRYFYNNPRAPKFGQPAIYQLIPFVAGPSVDGSYPTYTEIHESRLIIFPGVKVSRRITTGSTYGWGDSVLTRVVLGLRAWQSGHMGASQLLADFAQGVMKVKNLAELISLDGPGAFLAKLVSIDTARSLARMLVVDADGEDFERKATPMSGYPETLDRLSLWLAALCDMPLTKLMGSSAQGMNATGEGDDNNWDDRIAAVQQLEVEPPVTRLVEIILHTLGEDPSKVNHSVKFKPLYQPTQLEQAQARYQQAQTDALYITNDVLSPEEVARARFAGDEFSFETHVDFDARADQEAVVAPPVEADPQPDPIPPPTGPMPPGAGDPDGPIPEAGVED
jgi:phage-related protein (TIGR01555 family)